MLPHLSHDNGRKLGSRLYYKIDDYQPGETPSPHGYWGFLEPHADDPETCRKKNRLTLRWDMHSFQRFVRDDLSRCRAHGHDTAPAGGKRHQARGRKSFARTAPARPLRAIT